MAGADIAAEVTKIKNHIEEVRVQKRERLRDLDFFCLDNSIRESTVGQLRSHTLQNKIDIFNHVKKCGIKDIIVASFASMTRVDDDFVEYLKATGEDFSNFYSFSEVSEKGVVNGVYEDDKLPSGLKKNKKYGLINNFFECDLADDACEWDTKFTVKDMCKLLQKRIKFVHNKISPQGKCLLNLRDFPIAMSKVPERVLEIVKFLATMPAEHRLFALCFEDPLGEYLPEELEAWTASVRRTMDANGWESGKILVHIHQKWDLQTASQLDCLSAGADGVWASLCEEGAALGHACSSITMMNLVRLGNKKILKKYNCTQLRKAAMAVTTITTGKPPHPKQVIYGERAVDLVFGFLGVGDFDVAEFFGVETPNRITSLVTVDMLKDRLTKLFGEDAQFNDKICGRMKEVILLDLREGRKEEYQSSAGLALLFDRSGGQLTPAMSDVITKAKLGAPHHDNLIALIRKDWDAWDNREEGEGKGDGQLQFDSFYHGFMAPYFGCYRCSRTKKGLAALDMDSDGTVDWKEFLVYIKWALRQYPDTEDPDVLMKIVFEKGLIPAMRDEKTTGTTSDEEAVLTERIRNFSIVAHVDHGKSTLADRMLEMTGVIDKKSSNKQVLDHLPVERERGITVKAQTATMFHMLRGTQYMLNLIDTPGHVDFNYEVSRSLGACQGVLLLVDAQQGVQAQTVANFLLAFEGGLDIIPVINKIDLGLANVPGVVEQIGNAFGFGEEEILKISAKHGTGVDDLFPAIISRFSKPPGDPGGPLKALLYDSWYDKYRGVICIMAITDGVLHKGDELTSLHTGNSYSVVELGLLQTKQIPQDKLCCGQVGYVVMGIRSVQDAHIGDTFHRVNVPVDPLPGFKPAKPMVFAGVYPIDTSDYLGLRTAIEKLTLNDSSVSVYPDSSVALGQGWRLGFLGLLHMDVFKQRLEEEYDASIIITSPSVPYKAVDKEGQESLILNPSQFPEVTRRMDLFEPIVMGTLVFPDQYLGKMLKLCEDRRGIQKELLYLDQSRVMLKYELPLSEIVVDFYDQVKSISSGYASFDYEDCGFRNSPLVKLDILLNGDVVDALALIVHKEKAHQVGKRVCEKLKEHIHRQLFEIAIQAAIGSKVIARETVKALRKDVTAKCYGGDISRKMKLLKRQKEGKKKMKMISNVELSKEAFLSVLQR